MTAPHAEPVPPPVARRLRFVGVVVRLQLLSCASLLAFGCYSSHGVGGDGGAFDATITSDAGVGADADGMYDAGVEPASCDAEDAEAVLCPDRLCDGPGTWHWNGDGCFWIDCGACVGTDCSGAPTSEGECRAAHSHCEASLCRDTGGTWMWWALECAHFACGGRATPSCDHPRPVCDCGPNHVFADLFDIGDPALVGCHRRSDCPVRPERTREELCTDTGGSWEPICCDTVCGAPCAEACTAMACDCGSARVFRDVLGCRDGARCHERRVGESCDGVARCEGTAICCASCTGSDCTGTPTCREPVCDGGPLVDECGNDGTSP
jgi:hypothetical protein